MPLPKKKRELESKSITSGDSSPSISGARKLIRKSEKIYNETNVYDALITRLQFLFNQFDNVCFSVSGGKDSGTLLQIANIVATKMHAKFSVLYIDLEAGFQATKDFMLKLRKLVAKNCTNFYWVCLPFCEDNATSALNPEFITWDESAKDYWVSQPPEFAITIETTPIPFPFYTGIADFDTFTGQFSHWFHQKKKSKKKGKNKGTRTAQVVGIRTDESLRRYMAITNEGKLRYKDQCWTTAITEDIYAAYPLYDWKTADIWGAVSKFDLLYNQAYEGMYKNGVPVSQQRICQPFGQAQKAGLDQFRFIEPETWERLLQRVEGVNFGAIYCRTSLLGHMSSMKPAHLSWEQYAVFLLESIGLYEPMIQRRYYEKIKYYMLWGEKNEGIPYGKLPETGVHYDMCWQRVARAIERNDFYLTYLDFGYDKAGDDLLIKLREKHRATGQSLTGQGHIQNKLYKKIKSIESKGLIEDPSPVVGEKNDTK
jgi:predicted phosphoadenosine phosphosulfate sulfurtransferase